MASALVYNAYGKTGVRLLRLLRGARHEVLETNLEIRLEGTSPSPTTATTPGCCRPTP